MKLLSLITFVALASSSLAFSEDECVFFRHVKPLERLNFLVCTINFELPPTVHRVTRVNNEPIEGVLVGDVDTVTDPSLIDAFPAIRFFAILNHRVESLRKEHLAELTMLEGFDLSRGELSRIEFDAFQDMERLRDVDLSRNRLDYIHPQLFTSLVGLEKLRLDGNQLVALEGDIFGNNKKLTLLNLANNRLSFIAPRALEGLFALRELYLAGNQCVSADYKPPRIPQLRYVFAQQCKESNEVIDMLSQRRADAEGFDEDFEDVDEN